jgi:uncharacterized membrane protein YdbT with pleckstrin-like domain
MRSPYLENLLGEREQIILVTRQHWLVLAQRILPEILIFAAMLIILTVGFTMVANPILAWMYLALIIPLISLLRDVLIWSHHQYIVTNRRVIQIFGVLNKNVTDSSLEKVNDVKMIQSFLGRIFDYGDVEILTASELGVNRFTQIGDPIRFKTAMLNAKEKLEMVAGHGLPETIEISAMVSHLGKMHQIGAISDEEFRRIKTELLEKL